MSVIQDLILDVIENLPTLAPGSYAPEESCPICLLPFDSILKEQGCLEQHNLLITTANYLGITKLACGHLFCKKDLSNWIQNFHGSCPTCRHVFLDITFPSDSDNESSDGGEWLPGIEDDEDDEYFGPDEFDGDDMEYDVDTHAPFELEELEAFLSEDPEDFHEDECWFTDEPTDVDLAPEDFDDMPPSDFDPVDEDW